MSNTGIKESELPEVEIRITPAWIRCVRFCYTSLPHGQLCVRIVNGQPTELVEEHTKRKIRFDKEEVLTQEFGDVKFT